MRVEGYRPEVRARGSNTGSATAAWVALGGFLVR